MKRKPSIIQANKESFINPKIKQGLMPHEPIGGKSTNESKKEGLWIWVTFEQHRWIHDTQEGELYDRKLCELMQQTWLEKNDYDLNKWYSMFYQFYL